MAFAVQIASTLAPGRPELLAYGEGASWANARWFLDLARRGLEIPCCPSCAGLLYQPARPGRNLLLVTGAELVARVRASCDELSAWQCGYLRARAMLQGASVEQASHVATYELTEMQRAATVRGADVTYHATVRRADGSVWDPAEHVPRTRAATKICGGNCG